jgi:hypothetical protein
MTKQQKKAILQFLATQSPLSALVLARFLFGTQTPSRSSAHHETLAVLEEMTEAGELERDAQGRWCLPREPGSPGRPRGRGNGVRDRTIPVKVTGEELKRWKAAAKTSGESLSAWLRSALDEAAEVTG